jgi:hypothetical protein
MGPAFDARMASISMPPFTSMVSGIQYRPAERRRAKQKRYLTSETISGEVLPRDSPSTVGKYLESATVQPAD